MKKLVSILLTLALVASFALAVPVVANDVSSSTIVFENTGVYILTDNGDGTYTGMIPCVVDGGFDIYAKNGATAYFSEDPNVTISSHDAWSTWTPDTPDWYQYSLKFWNDGGVQRWRVANHSGATAEDPWYDGGGSGAVEQGVPMSGIMDWDAMYAAETDIGEYLSPINPDTHPKHPHWAGDNGGGPACWDMDWSWGSEVVPLHYPGFNVNVEDLGSGDYRVTLTPGEANTTTMIANVPDIVAISVSPTVINFGTLLPNETSDEFDIIVENIGTQTADVDADVSGSGDDLFYKNLELKNSTHSGAYTTRDWKLIVNNLVMGGSETLKTQLPVPSGYTPKGSESATLTFTASPAV